MTDLYETQLELENRLFQSAHEKSVERLESKPQYHPAGQTALNHTSPALIKAIQALLDEKLGADLRGRAATHRPVYETLAELGAPTLAALTGTRCIQTLTAREGHRPNLTHVAHTLGEDVLAEVNMRRYAEASPGHAHVVTKRISGSADQKYRRAVLANAMRAVEYEPERPPRATLVVMGLTLIEAFISATGYLTVEQTNEGVKRKKVLAPTPKIAEWLKRAPSASLRPLYEPMVVRPVDWEGQVGGGYLSSRFKSRIRAVKTHNPEYQAKLADRYMPGVYAALNAIQSVPWKVNTSVLRVMEELYAADRPLAGLPNSKDLPLPARPPILDTGVKGDAAFDEALKAYKAAKRDAHEFNAKLVGKRLAFLSQLAVARKFAEFERFYFPHQLDWRGRAYPVPTRLQPQGDDVAKGLLVFAEGKPLGETGAYWLAVHLANTFGEDKGSFDERVRWVAEHTEQIMDSALRPTDGDQFWLEADKPWQFLAACFEWTGFMVAGHDYVSNLPVAVDGSCNGLQNFSAMLRDEIGGAATNLVPADKPSDIYTEVLRKVAGEVGRRQDEEALAWWATSGELDRKMVKRPVMTRPYGSGQYGITGQIEEEMRKRGLGLEKDQQFTLARALSPVVYNCIGEVVVGAKHAMDWLQEVAKAAAKNGQGIYWTTPIGFLARQAYMRPELVTVELKFMGSRLRLQVSEGDTKTLNKNKQRNGVSPNYVHSMDGSHMMLTVLNLIDQGITDFAMVHDSYATHACHVDTLGYLLRSAFVEQYTPDVLAKFRKEVVEQLPEELAAEIPPVPARGSLDLEAVHDSEYFFA